MKKIACLNQLISLMALLILSSCATIETKQVDCDINVMGANGKPCWVNKTPETGVVVYMSQHIKPEKTREILFKKAVVELAAQQEGLSISESAVVKKVVEVHNDAVSGHSSVTSFAVVRSANESTLVKARIKDSWLNIATQKMYMWVILEDSK